MRRRSVTSVVFSTVLVATMGCGRGDVAPAAAAAVHPATSLGAPVAGVIDSEIPIAEQLRRFRAAGAPAAARATRLTGGAPTRDSLVRAFVHALAAADSASLHAMLLSREEFADLYYPESRFARPPYELAPGLLWFQQTESSNKGYARALRFLDGRPARLRAYHCDGGTREGANRVWGPCALRITLGSRDTTTASLFGGIVERDGRFKFLSYANPL